MEFNRFLILVQILKETLGTILNEKKQTNKQQQKIHPTFKYFKSDKELQKRKQRFIKNKAGQILILLHERVTTLDGRRHAERKK